MAPQPRVFPDDDRMWVWFFRNRYDLLEALVAEAERAAAPPGERRARFLAATRHAKRVLLARLVVTVLLALGAITTVASAVLAYLARLGVDTRTEAADALLETTAAWAGSSALVFLALRLLLDRALVRYDVVASFLARSAL